jgi:DNA polymerase
MEILFKNILKKAKAIQDGSHPISHTFAGDLFRESAWYLSLQNIELEELAETVAEVPTTSQHSLCKLLFLGDTYNGVGEDLLQKMIVAMNLGSDGVKRISFDENNDQRAQLIKAIVENRPQVVVSLGAIVTNMLLEKKEKLSSIHGQLLPQEASDWKYLLVPVFHPEFLLINPNMKRTAWNDLQKIMEYFKKES